MAKAVADLPPGPSKFSPKLLRQLSREPIKTLGDLVKEYGEIVYFKIGRGQIYIINNPDYIEKILIYNYKNFKKGKRLQTAKRLLGEGLVTSEGTKHDNQRKIVHPLFLPKKITSYGQIVVDKAILMHQQWVDGSIIDIHKDMMNVTLKIICKSIMDYEIDSEEAIKFSSALEFSKKYFKRLQHPIGHILDHFEILPEVSKSRESIKTLDTIVYQLITDRKKLSSIKTSKSNSLRNQEEDLLSRLLQAQINSEVDLKENQGSQVNDNKNNTIISSPDSMTDQQIRDNVITMLIAGHETTSNAITWTYYLLSQSPEIEQKMFEEIDSILLQVENDGSKVYRNPTVKDVPKFKYIEKIFRESMRIYPPVWSIGRLVEDDYLVDKYIIPKGSSIIMSQYVMHHDDKYYDKPEEFNPDRWTDEFKRHLPRFSYFPFGGGLRGCIGESFAWQEGILMIASVSSYWKLALVPNQNIKMDPGITLNPKNGIKMKPISRSN
jgi:cytochrome P450